MVERIPKIVVIGSTYIDMAFKCAKIPAAGQSVSGSALSYSLAGPGPLQAVQVALLGCQVHLISKVGGDPFGPLAKKILTDYKVNVDYVYTAPAKNTGVVVTHVNAEGENACCHYSGANCALLAADIDAAEELIAEAEVCLMHGCLPQEAITRALRCCELHRTKVIFDPSRPTEHENQRGLDLPVEYFAADVLIPNLYEAADITDQSTATIRTAKLIGSELVARGARCAVITMGRRGCMVVDRSGADHVPAFEVDLVDHTGSGAAFAGALAAYCAVKDDIREGVKFASAAGALACTKFGGIEALPSKADIIQLLQREDIDLLPRN
ncbi:MAG TPA: PfkB family carbohydrate kinase [Sedimentisphaerales bacterium]|nr:PfkB family carbohydrate kinase [Sedimentisphaerales bacterium]HRS11476.1 PfkB family carbohydrate kinase [Sedimentisphaerales bacterium]HRV47986.1 PfkB family carbohydrate kinase [Sedimentisphaerales bacterium]